MNSPMSRCQALRKAKEQLAAKLLEVPSDKRQVQPSDGGFSPAGLMEHMAKAEEFNLNYLRKTSPQRLSGRAAKPGFVYHFILKSFQSMKRTSAPPMLRPSSAPDLEAQHSLWMKRLDELETFVSQVPDSSAPFIKMNFMFGTLSVDQFCEFQEAHTKYHDHYFPDV